MLDRQLHRALLGPDQRPDAVRGVAVDRRVAPAGPLPRPPAPGQARRGRWQPNGAQGHSPRIRFITGGSASCSGPEVVAPGRHRQQRHLALAVFVPRPVLPGARPVLVPPRAAGPSRRRPQRPPQRPASAAAAQHAAQQPDLGSPRSQAMVASAMAARRLAATRPRPGNTAGSGRTSPTPRRPAPGRSSAWVSWQRPRRPGRRQWPPSASLGL